MHKISWLTNTTQNSPKMANQLIVDSLPMMRQLSNPTIKNLSRFKLPQKLQVPTAKHKHNVELSTEYTLNIIEDTSIDQKRLDFWENELKSCTHYNSWRHIFVPEQQKYLWAIRNQQRVMNAKIAVQWVKNIFWQSKLISSIEPILFGEPFITITTKNEPLLLQTFPVFRDPIFLIHNLAADFQLDWLDY